MKIQPLIRAPQAKGAERTAEVDGPRVGHYAIVPNRHRAWLVPASRCESQGLSVVSIITWPPKGEQNGDMMTLKVAAFVKDAIEEVEQVVRLLLLEAVDVAGVRGVHRERLLARHGVRSDCQIWQIHSIKWA